MCGLHLTMPSIRALSHLKHLCLNSILEPDCSVDDGKGGSQGGEKSTPLGAIIGGAAGGVFLLGLIAFFIFWRQRKSRKEREVYNHSFSIDTHEPSHVVQPYYHSVNQAEPDYNPYEASSNAYPMSQASSSAIAVSGTGGAVNSAAAGHSLTEKERLRQARQAQLTQRLRAIEQEAQMLENNMRGSSASSMYTSQDATSTSGDRAEVAEMREEMRRMQEEIAMLRRNQASPWAQGLTDEPPPGYDPNPTSTAPTVGSSIPSGSSGYGKRRLEYHD